MAKLRLIAGTWLHNDDALAPTEAAALLQHIAALTGELKRNQDGWAEAFRLAVQHQERANKAEKNIAALEQSMTTVKGIVDEIHAFLVDHYCQCGSLPEQAECYWHKLFDIGVRLQAALPKE